MKTCTFCTTSKDHQIRLRWWFNDA